MLTDGPVRLTWSGRLDNADDLVDPGGAPLQVADARRIGRVLAQGPEGVGRCLGDFACAAWWPEDRRLLLARDAMGMRPLYYASTGEVFWWASTLAALLAPEWLPRELNEGYFAEYLTDAPVTLTETPIVGASRVPPASCLTLRHGRHRVTEYWAPAVTETRRLGLDDAADQFRSLLQTAVTTRLRGSGSVAFQLSGGLDSSSVVACAHRAGVQAPATYSVVFPDHAEADETPTIEAVIARLGCDGTLVPYRAPGGRVQAVFDAALLHGDLPELATGELLFAPLLRRAAADGHTAMLTGIGGDDYLSGSVFRAADLLREGHLVAALRYLRDYRATWEISRAGALRAALVPLVPAGLARALRAWRPAPLPPWVPAPFAVRTDLAQRMRAGVDRVPPVRSAVLRQSLVHLGSGDRSHLHDALLRAGRNAGLDMRQPYLDRRLVEFLISLPDALRFHQRTPRHLQRYACADLLPASVLARIDKADYARITREALVAADPDATLQAPMTIVERGWVDLRQARALWAGIQQRIVAGDHSHDVRVQALWQILAAEASVRALSSRHRHVPAV